jgi:hypothetical protein
MKEGGSATFLIPSKLAYGTQGYYTIPGYTPLLYDVQLVKVIPGPSQNNITALQRPQVCHLVMGDLFSILRFSLSLSIQLAG